MCVVSMEKDKKWKAGDARPAVVRACEETDRERLQERQQEREKKKLMKKRKRTQRARKRKERKSGETKLER